MKGPLKSSLTSGENPLLTSVTGPEFLNSKGDPKLFSLPGELDTSLCSGENCAPPQDAATAGISTVSKEACDWLWSKDTGLSSTLGDNPKLPAATSFRSGDTRGRTWLVGCSDFSVTSMNSSWFTFTDMLVWSFVSAGDPMPLLGVSFSIGEASNFSGTRGLNLPLDLGDDAVISS